MRLCAKADWALARLCAKAEWALARCCAKVEWALARLSVKADSPRSGPTTPAYDETVRSSDSSTRRVHSPYRASRGLTSNHSPTR
ncbi:hypothetical protein DWG14_07587 [Streptomyces griseorubiginosus]|uniref:Uncharacterized protein n=1 Tax=Streptomyces griseorubiginosus TaxID=67304 RepID=A0AAI8PSI3_9ACTN|nr:hypothetical protein DWG14_07587 [Streptomyces griseorubiginosus]